MTLKQVSISLLMVFFLTPSVDAINPLQPESSGSYVPGKGTRISGDYFDYYSNRDDSAFERHNYAKGLRLGAVEINPTLGYSGRYDSNVFLTEDEEDGDYINRLTAGIDAYLPMSDGKYLLAAGVHNISEWFVDNSSENHSDWNYQLGGALNFESFQLAINEDFRDTTNRSDIELTDRIQRYENRLGGLLTIPFGQFFAETEANHFILNFEDDNNNNSFERFDRMEFAVFPRIGMNVGERTQGLLEYGFTDIHYRHQEDRDGMAHQAQFGLRGFIGSGDLLSYQIWGGWQFRNYESSNLDDFNNFIGRAEMAYRPSELTQVIWQIFRRPEESITSLPYTVRNETNLRFRRQIAEDWFVNLQGGLALSDYPDDSRLDFLWEPGAGIEYILPGKIMALFAEYKFTARESNRQDQDYNRHLVNFGIKAEA